MKEYHLDEITDLSMSTLGSISTIDAIMEFMKKIKGFESYK